MNSWPLLLSVNLTANISKSRGIHNMFGLLRLLFITEIKAKTK